VTRAWPAVRGSGPTCHDALVPIPADVTIELGADSVSATGTVPAPPHEVFEFLRRPANHAVLSGDGSVRDVAKGDAVLEADSKFGMKMKVGVPYRVSSKVVEFEPDHLIAWCHFAGHRWRWVLAPAGDGTTVTETFDMSTSRFPWALRAVGYPKRHEDNVAASVANLIAHFSTAS
jgi:uncharacterized protein YndB with AHSA1/START domain